jgi:hypothetical protein
VRSIPGTPTLAENAALRIENGRWPAIALLLLLGSCNGSGVVRLVSLNASAIDPPPPEVWQFTAQESYYWLDDAGDLNLAMKCKRSNLFLGRFGDVELNISFVLDKPPAGLGRDYKIHERENRTALSSAVANMRFSAYMGIVSVIRKGPKQFKGSFRLLMHTFSEQQFFAFLSNNPGGVVCFGTFDAIEDARKGKAIRDLSEAGGWQRPPKVAPPASQQARH